jgi:hypothetical protein
MYGEQRARGGYRGLEIVVVSGGFEDTNGRQSTDCLPLTV